MSKAQRSISVPALRITQPIGEFFIGVMTAADLVAVSRADVRELERELDSYIGIQRHLSKSRVRELQSYVNTYDATFPTAVILAVEEGNTTWNEEKSKLILKESSSRKFDEIARIIDGQHRVEGLKGYNGEAFDVNVSIFVGLDIASQANIFATVNLAQTKVNRSLAYDLYEYQKHRSPQKSAHDVAVAIDRLPTSPFFQRVKRLGLATEGREGETLTQATIVEALLEFMTDDPMKDRDSFIKRLGFGRPKLDELQRRPFRGLFLDRKDADIAKIMLNFFSAVRSKWPKSWSDLDRKGNVLPRTNGFRALMRFLKPTYLDLVGDRIGSIPTTDGFLSVLKKSKLKDHDFNLDVFKPGTSGEATLYRSLMSDIHSQH